MMPADKLRTGLSHASLGVLALIAWLRRVDLGSWFPRGAGRRSEAGPGHFSPSGDPGFRDEGGIRREAALLGHEMNNYLCTLRGNTRLLRHRMDVKDRVIVDRIDRVVDKLESFARNLASKADATAAEALWQVCLEDAAKACVLMHFHQEEARFRWNIEERIPFLLGDPDRLEQVFLNLYANALEAGALRVTTSIRQEQGRLRVRVEDDGKGCAPEDLGRIFEPFFTTKQGPARRGLGMFIVQSIVENHGGKIQVRSKNGPAGAHGLVFTLDFPVCLSVSGIKPGFGLAPIKPRHAYPGWLLALPPSSSTQPALGGGPRSDGKYPIPSNVAAAASRLYIPGESF